jgi:hypothetical protein
MKYAWEAEVCGTGYVNKGRIFVLFTWDVLCTWFVKKSQNYYIKFKFFFINKAIMVMSEIHAYTK